MTFALSTSQARFMRVCALLLCLTSVTPSAVHAQVSDPIEVNKAQLDSFPAPSSEHAAALIALAEHYSNFDLDSAIFYYQMGLEESSAIGDSALMATALMQDGMLQVYVENVEHGIQQIRRAEALEHHLGDEETVATLHLNLANVLVHLGDIDLAIEELNKAMDATKGTDNPAVQGMIALVFGQTWLMSNNLEEAQAEYEKAIALYDLTDDWEGKVNARSSMAALLSYSEPEEALAYMQMPDSITRSMPMTDLRRNVAQLMGVIYTELNQLEKALSYLLETQAYEEASGQSFGAARTAATIATAYSQLGNYSKELEYLKKSRELALASGEIDLAGQQAHMLQQFYEQQGDFEKALEYALIYHASRDSIRDTENTAALAALDVKRTYEIKALEDSLGFVQRTAALKARTKIEKRTRNGLIGGVVLLLAFGAVLLNRYRITQKQKAIIEENALKLEESEAQRTRFFANISHEFRTPLSVINGMSELIQSNQEKWGQKGAKLIEQNGKSLLDLVNQILDLQKLEKDQLGTALVQTDIVPYLKNCTGLYEALAVQKGLDYRFESDVASLIMDFDREKILRIISNLVGNAIKFTESGEVFVRATRVEWNGSPSLRLDVSDTGIGVDKALIEKIFQRFYQVETNNAKVGQGTGIGLNYVHELVELLGGEMQVESTPGKGSQFTVVLPITNTAMLLEEPEDVTTLIAAASPSEWNNAGTEGPELLVIEDNPDIIELLLGHLSAEYSVRVAENGIDGIAAVKERIPDMVLSDVMMPGKDGFEVLDELKNDPLTSHIPVVMLTAKSDVESRLSGLRRGADDYIAKPFNSEELRLRLKNALIARSKFVERYAEGVPETASEDAELQLEDTFLMRIREVLHAHLDNTEFGIPEFCKELGVSRTQLHNKLKALTGKSTSIFLRELRLEKAQELLGDLSLSISEIAYQTGFNSPAYFTRVYTQTFGKSPSDGR